MGNTNGAVHPFEHAEFSRGLNGARRIRWDSQPRADELIETHYPTTRPEIIAAMVATLFPGHRITANMVIGRANRIGVQKAKQNSES